jgi:transposase-like protein
VQRIYEFGFGVEAYVALEGHRQVVPGGCPRCGGGLQRHGSYGRGVSGERGAVVELRVARFLCRGCRRTVSYLPSFCLSYRLVGVATVEAYLEGRHGGRDVQARSDLLAEYVRRMRGFARELVRRVGFGLGRSPPAGVWVWPWLREACGGLAAATRQLVTQYEVTIFRRYQCHQKAG